ncbi:hypothetical protein SBRY_10359 [Actinacidiphila bryophytorum]|uniref:Uncharacterized protein n=1 Tax=Actinacidiphila bryophytorum TaxID=1436133 RepID=A0A9W4E649_9ACTN|nr:hypothetical protein SBRY_10359 [Actinacidiphila bryophytorum]
MGTTGNAHPPRHASPRDATAEDEGPQRPDGPGPGRPHGRIRRRLVRIPGGSEAAAPGRRRGAGAGERRGLRAGRRVVEAGGEGRIRLGRPGRGQARTAAGPAGSTGRGGRPAGGAPPGGAAGRGGRARRGRAAGRRAGGGRGRRAYADGRGRPHGHGHRGHRCDRAVSAGAGAYPGVVELRRTGHLGREQHARAGDRHRVAHRGAERGRQLRARAHRRRDVGADRARTACFRHRDGRPDREPDGLSHGDRVADAHRTVPGPDRAGHLHRLRTEARHRARPVVCRRAPGRRGPWKRGARLRGASRRRAPGSEAGRSPRSGWR